MFRALVAKHVSTTAHEGVVGHVGEGALGCSGDLTVNDELKSKKDVALKTEKGHPGALGQTKGER
jgi:hypothetical protein